MSNYAKHVFNLSQVYRFVGKNLNHQTAVDQHSYRVSCLALAIADQYNNEQDMEDDKISVEMVLRKALLHDLEETITGDIPSPVKKIGNLRAELRNAGELLLKERVFNDTPDPEGYLKVWKQDKRGPSGEVIEVADKLEGLLSSYFEVKNGNWQLEGPFIHHLAWFESRKGKKLLRKFSYAKKEFVEVAEFIVNRKKYDDQFDVEISSVLKSVVKEINKAQEEADAEEADATKDTKSNGNKSSGK
jgi:5'-deoxynucleotidase YfbR-like HD superfamily hydrolase